MSVRNTITSRWPTSTIVSTPLYGTSRPPPTSLTRIGEDERRRHRNLSTDYRDPELKEYNFYSYYFWKDEDCSKNSSSFILILTLSWTLTCLVTKSTLYHLTGTGTRSVNWRHGRRHIHFTSAIDKTTEVTTTFLLTSTRCTCAKHLYVHDTCTTSTYEGPLCSPQYRDSLSP